MRPVDDTALGVPFIFAEEFDAIADLQLSDPRRDVDVVGDEQRLTRIQPQDKPLMSAPIQIVSQQAHHNAAARNVERYI